MKKEDERNLPGSCWNKARDDELLFILLGRDPSMMDTILFWVDDRIRKGLNKYSDRQIQTALALANELGKAGNENSNH